MNPPALICNYALLRFRPYADGGEFVNVGLVLWCEQARTFRSACDTRCESRVKAFFPELDGNVFKQAMAEMEREIDRINRAGSSMIYHAQTAKRAYQELIREREGMLTFGPGASVMTNDVDRTFEELLQRNLRTEAAVPSSLAAA